MDCVALKPVKIHLSAVKSEAEIANRWVEDLLLNLEDDWEVFFTLAPTRVLSGTDSIHSFPHQSLTLHLSYRSRKLYLQHQSFLC